MPDVSSRVAEVAVAGCPAPEEATPALPDSGFADAGRPAHADEGRPAPAEVAPEQSDSGFAEAKPVHGRQDTGCTEPFLHPRHTPSGIDSFSNTKEVYSKVAFITRSLFRWHKIELTVCSLELL